MKLHMLELESAAHEAYLHSIKALKGDKREKKEGWCTPMIFYLNLDIKSQIRFLLMNLFVFL